MLKTKCQKILLISACASFVLFLFSFKFTFTQNKPIQSALLNPSYRTKIQTLIIQTPSQIVTLSKKENQWECSVYDTVTFADTKTVENLIKNLTKIRNMYKISDKIAAKSELNLTEESANIITVIDSNQIPVTKLYFGSEDSLTSRINVTTEKGKISYETHNDISPFLTADLDFWTTGEIFFAIKNPSNLSLTKDELHTLLSLRHGNVLNHASLSTALKPVFSATIFGQYESSHRLDFYYEKTSEGDIYYYTQKISPEIINDNAVYELSTYTFDKIKSLLKKE